MFGLPSPSTRKVSAVPPRAARLSLEHLESRDTPSTLTISVSYGLGSNVTLSGDLTNTTTPANQAISIWGEAGGMPYTDANGHYSITLPASALGIVYAQTMDGSSNVATATLSDTAPKVFNFVGKEDGGNFWEFSGTVTWSHPFLTMNAQIQGPAPVGIVPATVQSNGTMANGVCTGTFDVIIELNGQTSDNGSYIATATDFWGTQSNQAVDCIWQPGT
jgi:hypothetical protein